MVEKEEKQSTASLLLDNFVALQKVLADVSIKLTALTEQISNLLKLFESSAKSFKERKEEEKRTGMETRNISEKLDDLIQQNKRFSEGLSLVQEEGTEKIKPKPLPEFRF